MINKRKSLITILTTAGLFLFSFVSLMAQPDPGGGGGTPSCWPPPCIPIDGGIGALLAAGVIFGVKKMIGLKKEGQNT